MLELQVVGAPIDLCSVNVNSFLFFFFFLPKHFFRTAIKACTLCAHQRRRCSPMKDGSREEDEDDEVEEVGSPRKRKRASTDEGSRDKKGKRKMTGGLAGGVEVEGSDGGKAGVNGLSLEEDCGVLGGD